MNPARRAEIYSEARIVLVSVFQQHNRIDDLFDKLGGCSHFSTLDLQAGYNQCRIRPEEEPLTAVRTPFGLFQWKVLSMGLTNAPVAFAAFMAKVFDEHLGNFVYICLDDNHFLQEQRRAP